MKFVTIIEVCSVCKHEWRYKVPAKEPNIFVSPVRHNLGLVSSDEPAYGKCRWCMYKVRYSGGVLQ